MRALILTYHSHHVVGPDYGDNDHLAFAQDLDVATECGFRIVPLATLVAAHQLRERFESARLVALTCDDGPLYDVADFSHPRYGAQKSFLNAMRDFRERHRDAQPGLALTSFVIASPDARAVMEKNFDIEYTYLGPDSLGDDWWDPAIDTGLIAIANHSWDHLHPALPEVAHSAQARGDFTQVRSEEDADRQIDAAARYIASRTRDRATPYFAFPFGHTSAYLVDEYLPLRAHHGVRAAFGTEPRAIAAEDSVWNLPRYVCGHHWRDPAELAAILDAA